MGLKILDGNDLSHELLLKTRQKAKLRNAFNNNMPTDSKLSKAEFSKIIESIGFLGSLLSKLACPLMKVAKKIHGLRTTTLIISNEEMNDVMEIVQALVYFNISLKGITKTIKNETKEYNGGFLSMLLGTLEASLLGNLLAGKGIVRAGSGNKKWKGIVRAGYGNKRGK